MPLQTADFFGNLPTSPLNPTGTDSRVISDDQHREILASLSNQCPNWIGAVTATHADVNTITGLAAAGTKPMPGVGGVTALYFYNADTPPPGWMLLVPDANIRQLVIGDAVAGGTIGGTQDPTNMSDTVNITISVSGNTGNTTLTANQSGMPAHNVTFPGRAADGGNLDAWRLPGPGAFIDDVNVPVPGQDAAQGHGHSFSASGSDSDVVTFTPRYARGILGVLNA